MLNTMQNSMNLLDVDKSVLLLIDIQTRLFSAMPPPVAQVMQDNSIKLLQAAEWLSIPILLTEQYPKGLGPTIEEIKLALPTKAQRFEKTAFSCCGCADFKQKLITSGRRQVVITGQETHVCVLQTAMDLLRQGMQVFVVEDAVCSRQELPKNNALSRMRQAGIEIVCYESVLFEWLRDAKHPHFKAISALVR